MEDRRALLAAAQRVDLKESEKYCQHRNGKDMARTTLQQHDVLTIDDTRAHAMSLVPALPTVTKEAVASSVILMARAD